MFVFSDYVGPLFLSRLSILGLAGSVLLLLFQATASGQPDTNQATAELSEYLLHDAFVSTNLSNPRLCAPGPGSWTITDSQNRMGITNGALYFSAKAIPQWGDPALISVEPCSRQPGRGFFGTLTRANGAECRIGFTSKEFPFLDSYLGNYSGVVDNLVLTLPGVPYQEAFVCRGTRGHFGLIKGGEFTDWTLFEVSENVIRGTLFAGLTDYTMEGALQDVYLQDLSPADDMLFSWATLHVAVPGNGETQMGGTEGIVNCVWKAVAGETFELSVRFANKDNRFVVRCSEPDHTVKLIKVASGVETELGSRAKSFQSGTEYLVGCLIIGNNLKPTIDNDYQYLSATDAFNSSVQRIQSVGGSVTRDLAVWPLHPKVEAGSPQWRNQRKVFGYGDEKTGNLGDEAPWSYGYGLVLCQLGNMVESPARTFHPGTGISQLKDLIDADLSAASGTPDVVCFNAGANDYGRSLGDSWKTNYAYILDAFHSKWPKATVGCTLPWSKKAPMSFWNSMATVIQSVLTNRTAWAVIGADERLFLENGDGGATFTTDGTHPNHAGYVRTAQAWSKAFRLPNLTIAARPGSPTWQVFISWPTGQGNYLLHSCPILDSGNAWQPVSTPPTMVDGQATIVLDLSRDAATTFYRLQLQ